MVHAFITTTALAFITIALLLLSPTHSCASAFQFWHTETQEKSIFNKLKLVLQETFRFDENGYLYHQQYDIGLDRELSEAWEVGINYRQIYSKTPDDIEEESRPQINALWKGAIGQTGLSDNSCVEYRELEHRQDTWRYRNKITANSPIAFFNSLLRPYVSNEFFVDMPSAVLSKNRLQGGFWFGTQKIKAELYYMRQSAKAQPAWAIANVIGSSLQISF